MSRFVPRLALRDFYAPYVLKRDGSRALILDANDSPVLAADLRVAETVLAALNSEFVVCGICAECGCDDDEACVLPTGPCSWTDDDRDLCTNPVCVAKDERRRRRTRDARVGGGS